MGFIFQDKDENDPYYDAVPTVDILMSFMGFHAHWMQFLATYIYPINQKVYIGYDSNVSIVDLIEWLVAGQCFAVWCGWLITSLNVDKKVNQMTDIGVPHYYWVVALYINL